MDDSSDWLRLAWSEQCTKVPCLFDGESAKLRCYSFSSQKNAGQWSPASYFKTPFNIPKEQPQVIVWLATLKDETTLLNLDSYVGGGKGKDVTMESLIIFVS